jgi:hypothetical protein
LRLKISYITKFNSRVLGRNSWSTIWRHSSSPLHHNLWLESHMLHCLVVARAFATSPSNQYPCINSVARSTSIFFPAVSSISSFTSRLQRSLPPSCLHEHTDHMNCTSIRVQNTICNSSEFRENRRHRSGTVAISTG